MLGFLYPNERKNRLTWGHVWETLLRQRNKLQKKKSVKGKMHIMEMDGSRLGKTHREEFNS